MEVSLYLSSVLSYMRACWKVMLPSLKQNCELYSVILHSPQHNPNLCGLHISADDQVLSWVCHDITLCPVDGTTSSLLSWLHYLTKCDGHGNGGGDDGWMDGTSLQSQTQSLNAVYSTHIILHCAPSMTHSETSTGKIIRLHTKVESMTKWIQCGSHYYVRLIFR
jgi:hypothetical protein